MTDKFVGVFNALSINWELQMYSRKRLVRVKKISLKFLLMTALLTSMKKLENLHIIKMF